MKMLYEDELGVDHLRSLLSKFMKKKTVLPVEPESPLDAKIVPTRIEEHEDYMILGNYHVRTLVVALFSNKVEAGFLDNLHTLGANISIVHHIEPTSAEAMIKYLDKAIREYRSQLLDAKLKDSERLMIENKVTDATSLIENLISSNSELFLEHMLIHIQAPSLEKLNRITHTVQSLTNRSFKAIAVKHRMFDAFESVLPLNKNKVKELTYRNFDAEALSSLFALDESEIISEKGIIKGRNLKTRNVVKVDPYELLNMHEFVVGPSGSGKSTYLFGDMFRRWSVLGVRIRVIDPKGDYGRKFEMIGGEWVKISTMNNKVINPFEILNTKLIKNEEGNAIHASLLHRKISNLKTMFSLMCSELKNNAVAKSLLEKVLIQTYENAPKTITWDTDFTTLKPTDYPILVDFYSIIGSLVKKDEEYKPLNGLYQVLYQYVEGSYSKAMNGYTNVDLSNDLISFDLFDLKNEEEFQKVVMFNILTFLEEDAVMGDGDVQIYVDEAHILADPQNPLAMKFLSDMYKLLRSFGCGITSAIQQIGDFLSAVEGTRNYGEAIILNSMSKLYLPMSREELHTIMNKTSENFSEEEQQILVIKDADRRNAGKGIYVLGSKKASLQVELTPIELQLWDPVRMKTEYPTIDLNDELLLPILSLIEDTVEIQELEPILVS
jgi:type IV secretory pathway VirB4 component